MDSAEFATDLIAYGFGRKLCGGEDLNESHNTSGNVCTCYCTGICVDSKRIKKEHVPHLVEIV